MLLVPLALGLDFAGADWTDVMVIDWLLETLRVYVLLRLDLGRRVFGQDKLDLTLVCWIDSSVSAYARIGF